MKPEPVKLKPKITIADHFAVIEDPRIDRSKRHKLIDIITIAVCVVICGADGWVAIETYGCAKYEWLQTFLELPNGIPSHDTFALLLCTNKASTVSRMFSLLDEINTEDN
ncbi:transposase family protein [uncultured Nostoc sp.]|uniref:transposase family protein n=1 Tax=uncultured Nostoc sp. TaxID=340711 RepID=UPI0035C9C553